VLLWPIWYKTVHNLSPDPDVSCHPAMDSALRIGKRVIGYSEDGIPVTSAKGWVQDQAINPRRFVCPPLSPFMGRFRLIIPCHRPSVIWPAYSLSSVGSEDTVGFPLTRYRLPLFTLLRIGMATFGPYCRVDRWHGPCTSEHVLRSGASISR